MFNPSLPSDLPERRARAAPWLLPQFMLVRTKQLAATGIRGRSDMGSIKPERKMAKEAKGGSSKGGTKSGDSKDDKKGGKGSSGGKK
jgi:hypothetical protein